MKYILLDLDEKKVKRPQYAFIYIYIFLIHTLAEYNVKNLDLKFIMLFIYISWIDR